LKRSDELAGLSRDHHQALAVALQLRRATPETADDAIARFREYFERIGDRHFDLEEAVLLPALPDDGEWNALSSRVRDEHRLLRAQGERVMTTTSAVVSELRELGDALEAHVRFEERQVFPFAEERLAPAELAELGRRLADDPE
jgi:hemerythrin-like domain-containing protein